MAGSPTTLSRQYSELGSPRQCQLHEHKQRTFSFTRPQGSIDHGVAPPERVAVPAPDMSPRPDQLLAPAMHYLDPNATGPRSKGQRTWSFSQSNPIEIVSSSTFPHSPDQQPRTSALAANRSLSSGAKPALELHDLAASSPNVAPAALRPVPRTRKSPREQNYDMTDASVASIVMPMPKRPESAAQAPVPRPQSTPIILQLEAAASRLGSGDFESESPPKRVSIGLKRLAHNRSLSMTQC